MTTEEKKKFLTEKIKLMLDDIGYGITSIMTHFSKDALLRDGTYRDVFITSFYEPVMCNSLGVVSNADTLDHLYVQTGPMNFVDIEDFFKPNEEKE
ncbi:hypothetical protein FIA58_007530 [Flavobacterium jejuense]|uniref:Uncharacterized protein n=1 Tax=Flavobacterium jejuense TaxID=1544455 RepID=A0ABX0IR25_9FLAO|nr:hypothetical protein [Flavobacterium jejuense]NHN25525.1 hypothetical protein [Flavobacterium jejuense]